MKSNTLFRNGLVLLVLATAPLAQEAKKPQQAKPTPAVAQADFKLSISVTGLTTDNQAKAKESLAGLSYQAFECASCKVEQTTPGKCPECKGDLASTKKPLLAGIQPSAESGMVTLTVTPGHPTRLSEIEGALKKNSIMIDPEKFTITGRAMLVIRGGTAADATTLEKALTEAKLFERVRASFDEATSEIRIQVSEGSTPTTRTKVATTLAGSGSKIQLADIVWGMGRKAERPG